MKSSLLPLIALLLAALPAFAQKDVGDRVRVLRSIVIDAGESAGDVICFGCSVRVRGQVQTDVVSIGGSVEVEGSTESDVVAIGGGIHLGPKAKIGGDAVAVGGYVTQDPGAQVAGETVPIPYIFIPGQRQLVAVGILTVAAVHLCLVLLCYAILRQRRARNVALALSKKPWQVLVAGVGGWPIICGLYYVSELISETRLGVNAGDIGYHPDRCGRTAGRADRHQHLAGRPHRARHNPDSSDFCRIHGDTYFGSCPCRGVRCVSSPRTASYGHCHHQPFRLESRPGSATQPRRSRSFNSALNLLPSEPKVSLGLSRRDRRAPSS